MEIQIQNSRASSISFPQRKQRNKSEKNLHISDKQKIFLEIQKSHIDGSNGDVIVKLKTPPHLKQMIADGKININGVFIPHQTDPEIEGMLTVQEKILLNGKTIKTASMDQLLSSGILTL